MKKYASNLNFVEIKNYVLSLFLIIQLIIQLEMTPKLSSNLERRSQAVQYP